MGGGDVLRLENNRAGQLMRMQSGYECFVPHNLKYIDNMYTRNM